jgi:hypothetical protein
MLRKRRDRGATLVETAVVLPLVILLAFGVIEFGLAWRDVNTMERSLQTAGRTGSGLGRSRYADYETLRSLSASLAGMSGAEVSRVIIYDVPPGSDGEVPQDCLDVVPSPSATRGVSGLCNVYSAEQANQANPGAGFRDDGSGSCAGSWDANFCPITRDDSPPNTSTIGVFVEISYRPVTNLIPGPTFAIDERAVFAVEPCIPGLGVDC